MPTSKIQRYFRHGTLTQLRVFEAVARLGSYTRTGEETHMAQPTVSVLMRKLAETVGVQVLERVGKRVRLTAAGEELYSACQSIFETFVQLDEAIADIRGLKAGKLRIATTTAGEYLLPQLLAPFVKRHPGIEVSLHVGARETVLERFTENADDLYLLTNPPSHGEIVLHPILPNPLVALAPATHPLATENNIAFKRFAREPLLVREPGSGTRLAVDDVFSRHALQPRISMELGSNEAIKEAMISGLGISLMYRYALGFDIESRRLAILDVEGLPKDGHWHFVHPCSKQLPFIAQTFVAFARKEAKRIFDERMAREAIANPIKSTEQ
jgi:DNA-binding transcriptional LysR family regulator